MNWMMKGPQMEEKIKRMGMAQAKRRSCQDLVHISKNSIHLPLVNKHRNLNNINSLDLK
jgi:hypothetical protein